MNNLYSLFFTFILLFILSCSDNKPNQNTKIMTPAFNWNVQYGDNKDSDSFEEKGAIDYPSFINELSQFPWLDEIRKANRALQCSPTLTVVDKNSGYDLFVSGYGEDDGSNTYFIVGLVCSPSGIFKRRKVITIETKSLDSVARVYDAFFKQDFDLVKSLLK